MTEIAFIIGYLTLAIELLFFHVPSVANTQNFFRKNKHYNTGQNKFINDIQNWSVTKKIILLAIPAVMVQLYFLLPLLYFFPLWHDSLFLLFEPNVWTDFLGLLCVVLGRVVTFGSMLYLRKENRQTGKSFTLHTGGIFRFTRNPGLDGMFLFFIGLGLLFPSILIWLGLIFYIYYMVFRVRIEEAFLQDIFKDEFVNYQKQTNRFLLFK
ncbi:MAG: methyltransferase family protein [Flavobacterium sp.]|uniref:methyltransferase family protein n=1 Tax=Flavobacterium sp. TaxID=239 RepID=UPI00391C1DF7